MGEFVSPEYQESLDRLAESLRQARETKQAEFEFDRVFVPRLPLSFFEDAEQHREELYPDEGEALPPIDNRRWDVC